MLHRSYRSIQMYMMLSILLLATSMFRLLACTSSVTNLNEEKVFGNLNSPLAAC